MYQETSRAEVCVVELAEGVCTKKLRVPKFVPWNEPLGEVAIKSDIRMLFCACDMCAYVVLLDNRYI